MRLHEKFNMKVSTREATAEELYEGTFITFMPLSVHISNAMLLKPVPASHITLTEVGNLANSDEDIAISFVINISSPAALSIIISSVGSIPTWS
jgi:hypothetical protein